MLCAILLAWAAQFSGYATPEECPNVREVSSAWMLVHSNVKALMWYPQEGDTIYVDRESLSEYRPHFQNALMVHEMTHWLDHLNGKLDQDTPCHQRVMAERRGYYAQQAYLEMFGSIQRVSNSSMFMFCED
jgi:hypothetical protein